MRKLIRVRLLVLIVLFALVAAACGGDDDDDVTTTAAGAEPTTTAATTEAPSTTAMTTEAPTTTAATTEPPAAGALTFGGLLPETGSLAFLGPPEIAGAMLAVEDINAAGGVGGSDVVWIPGDSGDTSTDIANSTVDSHLAAGVHAIIGAASSGVSFTVIDKITGAGVIHFSPANTSAAFTTYDDNGLYFRTAPSDELQGQVLAEQVLASGALSTAVLYRQEPYGEGLAERFQLIYEELGGEVSAFIAYPPEGQTNFDAEVDQLVQAGAEAIVVISFEEGAVILETMHERGIGPTSGQAVWGVDGNITGMHGEMADPSVLAGMRGTQPSVDLSTITDFTGRLDAIYTGGLDGIFAYGAETYDAMIVTALAAQVAGSLDPIAIAAEINDVTRAPGEVCTTFADCVAMIDAGTDIDYDGISGPLDFVDAGEPAAATYQILTLGEDGPDPEQDVYVFAELQQ